MSLNYNSTIKIPVQNWTTVKKVVLTAYNTYVIANFIAAKTAFKYLEDNRPKGSRNYNYLTSFNTFMETLQSQNNINKTLIWDSLWSAKNPDRRRPVQPKKNFFQLANNQTKQLRLSYVNNENFYRTTIAIGNKDKTLNLDFVSDNDFMLNNCCYPDHPVIAVVVDALEKVRWQKDTGGTLHYPTRENEDTVIMKQTEFSNNNDTSLTEITTSTEETSEEQVSIATNPAFISLR